MSIQQISVVIVIVGLILIGLVLYAAYKVAEKKDLKNSMKKDR